jgi:hypothetical protein
VTGLMFASAAAVATVAYLVGSSHGADEARAAHQTIQPTAAQEQDDFDLDEGEAQPPASEDALEPAPVTTEPSEPVKPVVNNRTVPVRHVSENDGTNDSVIQDDLEAPEDPIVLHELNASDTKSDSNAGDAPEAVTPYDGRPQQVGNTWTVQPKSSPVGRCEAAPVGTPAPAVCSVRDAEPRKEFLPRPLSVPQPEQNEPVKPKKDSHGISEERKAEPKANRVLSQAPDVVGGPYHHRPYGKVHEAAPSIVAHDNVGTAYRMWGGNVARG